MNNVIIMGRLTRDPEVRNTQGGKAVAHYTLAVDRAGKDKGADFIPCVAWDKAANFAGNYFRKGLRVLVSGRLQTGSYKDRDGKTVYTTDVVVFSQEFADGKAEAAEAPKAAQADDFLPADVEDAGLPWSE